MFSSFRFCSSEIIMDILDRFGCRTSIDFLKSHCQDHYDDLVHYEHFDWFENVFQKMVDEKIITSSQKKDLQSWSEGEKYPIRPSSLRYSKCKFSMSKTKYIGKKSASFILKLYYDFMRGKADCFLFIHPKFEASYQQIVSIRTKWKWKNGMEHVDCRTYNGQPKRNMAA